MTDILVGVVGSHAYGLNHADSDVDLRGIFVAPTKDILGLQSVIETIDQTNPDICKHEVHKFMRLALAGNPNIMEMLYLDNYVKLDEYGKKLIEIRQCFLSDRVRHSYGGYAISQMKRLVNRGDGSFSSDTRKRTAKHARHCFRLIQQGNDLLTTGVLKVKVDDPEYLFWLGDQDVDKLEQLFTEEFGKLDTIKTVLPPEPDWEKVNEVLLWIRENH
jgi:hypothetical protein